MNLQDLASIGELVGGIAVLITLLYLAYQLKQNTTVERASAQRDLLCQIREWWHLSLEHPFLFEVIRRGLDDWESLTAEEKDQFNAWAWSFLNIVEQAELMRGEGFANESSYKGFLQAFVALAATPGGSVWWSYSRNVIEDHMSLVIDAELKSRSPDLPTWKELFPQFENPQRGNEANG